jgi:DNA-directed RNA polymerase specialized sigma24 family protein
MQRSVSRFYTWALEYLKQEGYTPTSDELATALAALPDGQRAVLEGIVDGKGVHEIAHELGISASAARNRAFHGRANLKALLVRLMQRRLPSAPRSS